MAYGTKRTHRKAPLRGCVRRPRCPLKSERAYLCLHAHLVHGGFVFSVMYSRRERFMASLDLSPVDFYVETGRHAA